METTKQPSISNEASLLAITDMKVEVISSETIKPSSPTPRHLRNFKLSLCDQQSPVLYIPIILYYPTQNPETTITWADRSQQLKSSLSVLLAFFYPFAGRIKDNFSIECNDEGAKFLGAKVDCRLSELLIHPDPKMLKMLLPIEMESVEASTGYIFLVQANFFRCGGLALGMCVSHKITDGTTLCDLITSWANLAIDPERVIEQPQFDASTFFPPSSNLHALPVVKLPKEKTLTRRYVFDSPKIEELVAVAKSECIAKPTRLEAICALIWRSAIQAKRRSLGRSSQRSVFSQAVNLRPRMSPPIPENTVGDLVGVFLVELEEEVEGEEDELLRKLVRKLMEEKEEFLDNFMKKEMVGEGATQALLGMAETVGGLMNSKEVELYSSSSWCRFSMYEADFGWGKPVWVSLVSMGFKNTIIVINGRGGDGMEVWLTLKEDQMVELDGDEELRYFASLNPGIFW